MRERKILSFILALILLAVLPGCAGNESVDSPLIIIQDGQSERIFDDPQQYMDYMNGSEDIASTDKPSKADTSVQPDKTELPSTTLIPDTTPYVEPPADTQASVSTTPQAQYTVSQRVSAITNTVLYDGGFFSVQLPENWYISTGGQYSSFSFYAWDPNVPERKVFMYCKLDPFLKSQAAKDKYRSNADFLGSADGMNYHLVADLPVIEPTLQGFFDKYFDYIAVTREYSDMFYQVNFPDLNNLSILETYQSNSPCTPYCLDNSIARISFTSDNSVACQGLVGGQVTDLISVENYGVDMGYYCVYDFSGITAPEGEFAELEEVLLTCLSSFTFTQQYVQEAVAYSEYQTDVILAQGRSMQAVYDSYNSAWSQRQTSYDIMSQKTSDATLGYDRMYDVNTGEIYQADVGFYDSYDANRESYPDLNLQIIDQSTEQMYLNGVDYFIN